jgi:hypothetical protein
VSNDALLVPLGIGAVYCLGRALRDDSVRWLAAGSTVAGLAVVTKLTAVGLVVLPLAVAAVLARRRRGSPRWRRAALGGLGAAGPVLLGLPWIAWNRATYGAFTGTAMLLRLEQPLVNPHSVDFTYATELRRVPTLFASVLLGQLPRHPSPGLVDTARVVGIVLLAVALGAGLAAVRRRPAVLLLLLPFVLAVAVLVQGTVSNDNPVFHERLLESWVPLLAAAPAVAAAGHRRWRVPALLAAGVAAAGCAALGWAMPT